MDILSLYTNCLWGHYRRILADAKVLSRACEGNTLRRSRFENNAV